MSKSTVSRALNGYPDIAEKTRLRVKQAAEELGYRPLAYAQAIRTGQARSLGLVLNIDSDSGHRPFLADFLDGISQRASEEGWTLTVATAASFDGVLETIKQLVEERKADGFILPRARVIDPRVAYLKRAQVPFVLYGRTGNSDDCAWFDIRSEKAMEEAVLRLAGLGHRRIGFLNAYEHYMYAQLRDEGFRSGMHKAGLSVDEQLVRKGVVSKPSGEEFGGALLDLDDPPTAIVCALDQAALGLYRAAEKRGITIGRDLSVIAYDGLPEGEYATPPLTTFRFDNGEAGAILADMLLKRIKGADVAELRMVQEARLVERLSHGPPRGMS
ncbi:substrate-binding domain-containing protein [Kiloniella sp. b19]|uniref:substrate-binding domain-containing protein n=1 Tax=Kiloniella sp. GXU_MW_B19 TaxID=3141326 RepID=UPI0031E2D107